jgi:hypothetical protein
MVTNATKNLFFFLKFQGYHFQDSEKNLLLDCDADNSQLKLDNAKVLRDFILPVTVSTPLNF